MSEPREPSMPAGEPDFTESYKLGFETIKQLTTLNAGSIVVIGTFLKDIFPSKNGSLAVGAGMKLLITLAFVSFGLSLIVSSYAMLNYHERLLILELLPSRERRAQLPHRRLSFVYVRLLHYVPLPSFTAGLLCFGLAVVLNLYR